jgi:hypothetical protein
LYLLDGHHRVQGARKAGVEVLYQTISVDDILKYGYESIEEVSSASTHFLTGGDG